MVCNKGGVTSFSGMGMSGTVCGTTRGSGVGVSNRGPILNTADANRLCRSSHRCGVGILVAMRRRSNAIICGGSSGSGCLNKMSSGLSSLGPKGCCIATGRFRSGCCGTVAGAAIFGILPGASGGILGRDGRSSVGCRSAIM